VFNGSLFAGPIYDLSFEGLDGKKVKLSKFKGKTMVVANTASACGYTPQLKDLEAIYKSYKDKGLVVLGFPSDDFDQEKKSGKELAQFCERNYGVTFPMFKKTKVKGKARNKLFDYLVKKSKRPKSEVAWNFEKFIVNKQGKVIARFKSNVKPTSSQFKKQVELALK
jgi:glutathione peroxidase